MGKEIKMIRNTRILIALLCMLISTAAFSASKTPDNTHFYFVQISDTHFGDADSQPRVEKVVESINAAPMKIECVVVTGDIMANCITDEKATSDALKTMSKLKVPVHYVPGNHDILEGDELTPTKTAYEKLFGPLATKTEYNGVIFLTVFTEPLITPYSIPGYDPMTWLEKELKDAGKKPVIIFHHGPAVDNFYSNALQPYWNKESKDKWDKLITSHKNIKAIISGHFHRDELHYIGDVPVFVGPPVSSLFARQPAYRVYEYDNGKISYRTMYP